MQVSKEPEAERIRVRSAFSQTLSTDQGVSPTDFDALSPIPVDNALLAVEGGAHHRHMSASDIAVVLRGSTCSEVRAA